MKFMNSLLALILLASATVFAAPPANPGYAYVEEYVYDFDVDGGATGEIELSAKSGEKDVPVGAVVESVTCKVTTAFTSGGSATLSWGNEDDADGYSGSAIAVASLTDNAVFNGWDNGAALIWDDTNDHPIPLAITDADSGKFEVNIGASPMTAGAMSCFVKYLYGKVR